MSVIVDDLKISNLEIVSNLGVRLSGDAAEIKTTQTDATLSVTSDGDLTLTSTTGDVLVGNAGRSIGFYGVPAVGQHNSNGNVLPGVTGDAVTRGSTFTGGSGTEAYTIGDIVLALKNVGILAKGV